MASFFPSSNPTDQIDQSNTGMAAASKSISTSV